MTAVVVRRLGAALVVVWLALTLAFVTLRMLPGDAVDDTMARSGASSAEIAARREELGLNETIVQQYVTYLAKLVRGDWGESLTSGQPVTELIAQNLPSTIVLSGLALLVGVSLGLLFGLAAGLSPIRLVPYGAQAISSLALSTPVYWTSTLVIYFFTVEWDVLPGVGGQGPRALILPAAVLGFHTAGSIAQVTANSLRETAAQDFVRTARAKGLPELDVMDHMLRVALLPVIAVIALQLGFLLGGTVITETIFVRRGIGRVLLTAISSRDYPVIQGIVVLAAMTYSTIHAAADVLMGVLDPRVGIEEWDAGGSL